MLPVTFSFGRPSRAELLTIGGCALLVAFRGGLGAHHGRATGVPTARPSRSWSTRPAWRRCARCLWPATSGIWATSATTDSLVHPWRPWRGRLTAVCCTAPWSAQTPTSRSSLPFN
jgi:hypothetical protein